MGYDLREHTADVAVAATGDSLGAAFSAAADGMAAAMCPDVPDTGGDRHTVTVAAESCEALLFDYLDTLIYERDTRSVLPVDNTGRVEGPDTGSGGTGGSDRAVADTDSASADADGTGPWRFEGAYRGVPLAHIDGRDLKAVTYSEMAIERTGSDWRVYVVFDV
jgi:SHS2 domain-containing protein